MATMAVGAYQTACEASPNKQQIDQWLNEGKAAAWISRELNRLYGEKISDRSIMKYKKYRDEWIQQEIEKDPLYQAQTQEIREQLNDGIGKIRKIDTISRLADVIDDSAAMLQQAKEDQVKIRTAQDFKFVAGTMLDAIKLYGDTVLKAQRFEKVNEDPSLLRPTTINVNVKAALTDILGNAMQTGGYDLIDKLRGASHGQIIQDAEFTEVGEDDE
jgi:hypothetical protein